MGNQASHDRTASGNGSSSGSGMRPPLRHILRNANALGLSKAELDERCKPSGLYSSCQWDDKAIRRLIGDGRLAPRLCGLEVRQSDQDQECPICFLNYAVVNVTKCCHANICTECYLQVRPQYGANGSSSSSSSSSSPKYGKKNAASCCPFCNTNKLSVTMAKAMDDAAIREREKEEQRVVEARMRARVDSADWMEQQQQQQSSGATNTSMNTNMNESASSPLADPLSSPHGGLVEQAPGTVAASATASSSSNNHAFGSVLAQNEHVARMRARSYSVGGSSSHNSDCGAACGDGDIAALAMTPDERRALEAEMRAQHYHPVAQRMEQEEAERRLQNELEYYQQQQQSSRRNHQSGGRSLDEVRAATYREHVRNQGQGQPQPFSNHRNGRDWNRIVDAFENNSSGGGRNGTIQSLDDLVVLEAAIRLSMEDEGRRMNRPEGDDDDADDEGAATAPNNYLARALRFNRMATAGEQDSDTTAASASSRANAASSNSGSGGATSLIGSFRQRRERSSSSRNTNNNNNNNNRSSFPLNAAALLLRGISEEEQIAMAIAASLEGAPAPAAAVAAAAPEQPELEHPAPGRAQGGEGSSLSVSSEADAEAVHGVQESEPPPPEHVVSALQDLSLGAAASRPGTYDNVPSMVEGATPTASSGEPGATGDAAAAAEQQASGSLAVDRLII